MRMRTFLTNRIRAGALVRKDTPLSDFSLRSEGKNRKGEGKKTLYTELGEVLFTHFGFSGRLILEASCHLPADGGAFSLWLDLKPGLTRE